MTGAAQKAPGGSQRAALALGGLILGSQSAVVRATRGVGCGSRSGGAAGVPVKISSRPRRPNGGVWGRCNRNVHPVVGAAVPISSIAGLSKRSLACGRAPSAGRRPVEAVSGGRASGRNPVGVAAGTVRRSRDARVSAARARLRLAPIRALAAKRPAPVAALTVDEMPPPSIHGAAPGELARPERPQRAGSSRPRSCLSLVVGAS